MEQYYNLDITPFWAIEKEPEAIEQWLNEVFSQVAQHQRALYRKDVLLGEFYKGQQAIKGQSGRIVADPDSSKTVKVTVNQIKKIIDMICSKVENPARTVDVVPSNSDEFADRQAAKMSKRFIDHLFYINKIQRYLKRFQKHCRIFGDGVFKVSWDPFAGDMFEPIAPEGVLGAPLEALGGVEESPANNPGKQEQLFDGLGNPIFTEDGEPVFSDQVNRIGDVRFDVTLRRYLILQPGKRNKEDCDWLIEIGIRDKLENVARYPEVYAGNQRAEGFITDIFTEAEERLNAEEEYVYCFYHRGTPFLDAGYYIEFTSSQILAASTLVEAVGHRELPFVFLEHDEDIEEPYGIGIVEQLLLLQVLRNALTSMQFTNIATGSAPKWLVNKASKVEKGSLNSSFGVIQYSGSKAPEIVTFKTVTADILTAIEMVDAAMKALAGVQDISFGQTPKRMDSGAGIAELQEIENRSLNPLFLDLDFAVEKIARLTLSTAGRFYRPEDKRTVRILGKGGSTLIQPLTTAKLSGPYDIKIERGTSIADSKAGRVALVKDILQFAPPGTFSKEEIVYYTGLADVEKFQDVAKAAYESQELENEIFLDGGIVAAPYYNEDHEPRWLSMVRFCQNPFYKIDIPEKMRLLYESYGRARESFLVDKMKNNPIFRERFLTQYQGFPFFISAEQFAIAVMAPPGVMSVQPQPQEALSPISPSPEEGVPV